MGAPVIGVRSSLEAIGEYQAERIDLCATLDKVDNKLRCKHDSVSKTVVVGGAKPSQEMIPPRQFCPPLPRPQ